MAGPCLLILYLAWALIPLYHIYLCWKIMCFDRNNRFKTGVDKTQRWDSSSVIIQANCFISYLRKLGPKKLKWLLKDYIASERAETKTDRLNCILPYYIFSSSALFLKLLHLHHAMGQIFVIFVSWTKGLLLHILAQASAFLILFILNLKRLKLLFPLILMLSVNKLYM